MNPHFRDLLAALKDAADAALAANTALVTANTALVTANTALSRAIEQALASNEEHEDLRETVHRLESVIEDLVRRLPPQS